MAIKTRKPDFPLPGKLRAWLEGLLADLINQQPLQGENTKISEFPGAGRMISAEAGGEPWVYFTVINGALHTHGFLTDGAPIPVEE